MTFLAQGKTNWIFILIVFVVAVFAGGGILFYLGAQEDLFDDLSEAEVVKRVEVDEEEDYEEATIGWQTFKNERYEFEFKHPYYAEVYFKDTLGLYYNVSDYGPIYLKAFLDFRFINPENRQEAEGVSYELRIFDLEEYRISHYYSHEVFAYDSINNVWYLAKAGPSTKEEAGAPITEDFIQKRCDERGFECTTIPRKFMETSQGITVYKMRIFADAGLAADNYIIINDKKELAFKFSKLWESFFEHTSPPENQEFVEKILEDFPQILSSFYFLK